MVLPQLSPFECVNSYLSNLRHVLPVHSVMLLCQSILSCCCVSPLCDVAVSVHSVMLLCSWPSFSTHSTILSIYELRVIKIDSWPRWMSNGMVGDQHRTTNTWACVDVCFQQPNTLYGIGLERVVLFYTLDSHGNQGL